MTVTYTVGGETKTLRAEGVDVEAAISLVPPEGRLLGVQYE